MACLALGGLSDALAIGRKAAVERRSLTMGLRVRGSPPLRGAVRSFVRPSVRSRAARAGSGALPARACVHRGLPFLRPKLACRRALEATKPAKKKKKKKKKKTKKEKKKKCCE